MNKRSGFMNFIPSAIVNVNFIKNSFVFHAHIRASYAAVRIESDALPSTNTTKLLYVTTDKCENDSASVNVVVDSLFRRRRHAFNT